MTTTTEPAIRTVVPASAMLAYVPQSVSAARRLVRDKLTDWELHALVDDAEVIVSELVTNAYRTGCHRRMAVTIRRITLQTVRIAVRDGSRTMPVMIDAGADSESGRGLGMVHQLTKGHWGVRVEMLGKTVHAECALEAPACIPGTAGRNSEDIPGSNGLPGVERQRGQ